MYSVGSKLEEICRFNRKYTCFSDIILHTYFTGFFRKGVLHKEIKCGIQKKKKCYASFSSHSI